MKRWLWLPAVAALVAASPVPARACRFAGPTPYVVDSAMQATDQVAPTLPPLSVARLQRGHTMEACSSNSCEGIGTLAIAGTASDDVTPAESIGYRFSIVAGALPPGFTLPTGASQVTVADDQILFYWADGAVDDQESIDFTLEVVAIDKAGNESTPQTVRVHDDTGGCAVARGPGPRHALAAIAGLALLGAASRRRRRAS